MQCKKCNHGYYNGEAGEKLHKIINLLIKHKRTYRTKLLHTGGASFSQNQTIIWNPFVKPLNLVNSY